MPIGPQEISQKRVETAVNKLIDIIDKKLQTYSEEAPFTFRFNENTDPNVKKQVSIVYQSVGWQTNLTDDILTLLESHKESKSDQLISVFSRDSTAHITTTEEGRISIGNSMVEAINTSLLYQSVARKILMVDELPSGTDPIYKIKEGTKSIYYSNGEIKPYIPNDEEIIKDFTFFKDNPLVTIEEFNKRKYYLFDQMQCEAKDSIQKQENQAIFSLIKEAANFDQTIYTYVETVDRAIQDSINEIENNDLLAAKMIMTPKTFRLCKQYFNEKDFEQGTHREIMMTGLVGHYEWTDMHYSADIEDGEIYVLPPAQFLGAYAIKGKITSVPCDKPPTHMGYLVSIEAMPILLNPQYVRKIKVKF